jgi:anti-sigma regulatory factor (Ser/Thr protein kinase)
VAGQETTAVVEQEFPPDPGQVRAARHFAMGVVGRWGLDAEDVDLVVSELATNAVLHGRSPFTLSLKQEGRRVIITVADDNSTLPMALPVVSAYARNGRGLGIVARLSVDWGVQTRWWEGRLGASGLSRESIRNPSRLSRGSIHNRSHVRYRDERSTPSSRVAIDHALTAVPCRVNGHAGPDEHQ